MPFETIHANHRVAIFPSPMEADLAILPASTEGRPTYPNDTVEAAYGYTDGVSARLPLAEGYVMAKGNGKKPILYVLTKGANTASATLIEDNLLKALIAESEALEGKKIWLPILGSETGELFIEEGFALLTKVLNQFIQRVRSTATFIISVPDTAQGRDFFEALEWDRQLTESSIDDLLTKSNCQIFLVSRQKKEQYLTAENTLQMTAEDIAASPAVAQIHQGDLLILHDSFRTKGGGPILRIRSIGMVTAPVEDLLVKVDWKMQDVFEDLEGYGPYEQGIFLVTKDVAGNILSAMDYEQQKQFYSAFGPALAEMARLRKQRAPVLRLAGIGNDGEKGEDYLDFTKDVDAFARVIAARSFEPPLAIVLFGKWGSGKSFFMGKLNEKIVKLSADPAGGTYCTGIAHIRFNAWSYMDANLWASLISQIFEALHFYIENHTASDEYKTAIARTIGESLQLTKDEVLAIDNKRIEVEGRLQALEAERSKTEKDFHKNLQKLNEKTLVETLDEVDRQFKASEQILAACEANASFITEEKALEKIVPAEYLQNPRDAYEKIRSTATFIRECCRGRSWVGNFVFVVVFLALFVSVPLGLQWLTKKVGGVDFRVFEPVLAALVPISVLFGRAQSTYKRMKPVIAAFWKVKQDYEHKREQARETYQQKEMTLKLAIEKDSKLLSSLTTELEKAKSAKAELEYKMANILTTEALYAFIQTRSTDHAYQKHLGIISIIRKDLEMLNDLFIGHRMEVGKADKGILHAKMTRPLERIVLYVDDLDRCPEDTVVQVLEAVNLLMAFPLFVVIVGVDPRWVKNALLKRHALQFTGNGGPLSLTKKIDPFMPIVEGIDPAQSITMGEGIDPARYLEKIFQIAFHLKQASRETIRQMIRKVAVGTQPEILPQPADKSPTELAETPPGERVETPLLETSGEKSPPSEDAPKAESESHHPIQPALSVASAAVVEQIEPLKLSDVEIELLEDLGELVGSNPRALKRFVNIYRIVRVHEDFAASSEMPKVAVLAVLFPLALSIGEFRQLYELFNHFVEHPDNREKTLRDFLQRSNQQDFGASTSVLHQLGMALSDRENYNLLRQTPVAVFADYNKFIRRFTFH